MKKRNHIRILGVLAFISAVTMIPAPVQTVAADQDKTITLAVCVAGPDHEWTENVMRYAKEELQDIEKRNGWNTMAYAAGSSYEQSQQVVDLVNQDVDCIVLQPVDGASLKTAAITVQRADIPLVIFDREIPEFAPTATVKGDNWGIGESSAEFFNNYFPDGTTIIELMGDTSTVPFQRTDGFDHALNDNIAKIQVGYTEWQREITRTLFKDWIGKQSEATLNRVGGVFTHDDEIALGVLDVLDELAMNGRRDEVFPNLQVIAGSSSLQRMYQRIASEEHYTLFSMTYNASMIKDTIRVAEKILKNQDYDEMTIVPTECVTKDNVSEYLLPDYYEYDENGTGRSGEE